MSQILYSLKLHGGPFDGEIRWWKVNPPQDIHLLEEPQNLKLGEDRPLEPDPEITRATYRRALEQPPRPFWVPPESHALVYEYLTP